MTLPTIRNPRLTGLACLGLLIAAGCSSSPGPRPPDPAPTAARTAPEMTPAPPAPVSSGAAVAAAPSDPEFVVTGQIVRGDIGPARTVATVDVERCFDRIPSYRKVKSERESRGYARYLLLLAQANEEFQAAVEWIALRDGIDLVVEKGGLLGGCPVDITDEVCSRLDRRIVTQVR